MSDYEGNFNDFSDEEDADYELSDDEGASFTVALADQGSSGGYHTRNKAGQQQREVITDRGKLGKAAYNVKCKAAAMIHGYMSGPGSDEATLIVYDFHFLKYKKSTRLKTARLVFEFKGRDGREGPLVTQVSPSGEFAMMETTQKEKVVRGANATAGTSVLGADVSAGYKWERTVEAETSDATSLTGEILGDEWGIENTANFTLSENESRKTGIPSFLRAAILLQRPDKEVFDCFPTIKVDADFKSWAKDLFSSREVDDPIIMNPTLKPVNNLGFEIDADNLEEVNLEDIFDCTFHKKLGGVVKSVKASITRDEKGVVEAEVTQVKEELVSVK